MDANPSGSYRSRRLAGAVLSLLVVLAVAAVAVPFWVIRPFAPQTPEGLAVAYMLRRWASVGTVLALAAGVVLAAWLWRRARWWSRTALALALAVLAGAVWRARENPVMFEQMFVPLEAARFAPAAEAGWVAENDPVLAVTVGGDAAAYPVRQVAYHHIVHDEVGGVSVAVTY